MPKRKFDAAITSDMKSVANDSFKDSIRMLAIEKLKASEENFYSMSDLELLADDIERQGLKHNLVVQEDADNPDSYFIISGHRRFAAIQLLAEQGRYQSQYVPCFVSGNKNAAETMLDLIMLNATTRRMTDAEYMQQYEFLEQTLKELDAAGEPVSGRMRERIAKALNVSAAQVGKIENILHNGIEEVQQAVRSGEMTISTASAVSSLPEEEQEQLTREKPVSEIKTKDAQERKDAIKTENASKDNSSIFSFSDESETSCDIPDAADEETDTESDFVDLEMFEEIPDAEPLSFMDALQTAMDIQSSLKTGLHSSLTFEDLNRAIDKTIAALQNLKGMI